MTHVSEGEKCRADHRDICRQLNIDAATEEQSWNSFQEVRRTYNLDGDPLHWQCCALYITCRTMVTPTVEAKYVLQGNCVSMTRLLRLCKISLKEFFKKINHWLEMTSQPEEFRNAISNLQHNFIVSMSIYQKYREVFSTIFRARSEDEQDQSPNRLFKFCWELFILAKAEYPEQRGDLLTSYYMLLCCLDLVYANAIADGRTDLVNPSFSGLPEGFLAEGEIPPEPVCIIEELKEENSASEIMTTRNTIWQNAIKGFFRTGVLRGNADTFMELITVSNFEDNLKALDSLYNTFILSCGEFDERIALEQKPLDDGCKFNPISIANASVTMLRTKLSGYTGEPQGSLKELFKTCALDPINIVRVRLDAMRDKFASYMCEHEKWSFRAVSARFDMIEALYYRLLENIIRAEMRRCQTNIVRELCSEDMFNQTLLVCSAEIVNYAHNLQQNFPYILNVFEMTPFIFYRIIEIVVLHHNDLLSGEIIKHLNIIADQCIESLAWTSSSLLWHTMDKVPTAQEVESSTDLSGMTPDKPDDGVIKISCQPDSTLSTSMAAPSSSSGSASRREFRNPDSVKKRQFKMDEDDPVKPDTSEGKDATEAAEGSEENKKSPIDPVAPRVNQSLPTTLGFMSPLKRPIPNVLLSMGMPGAASLNLFFRKYYSTALLRMNHLCTHLNLLSTDIVKQIWTIFEYSIVNCTKELMRDRHLDQMVMCSIYLFARIKKLKHKFADIMKVYRTLPQSYSHVYRSVFISRLTADQQLQQQQQQQQQQSQYGTNGNREGGEDTRRVQPGDMAGVSVQHGGEERGDIIQFYNTVYIKVMQNLAIQFGNEDERSLMLSPIPKATNRCVLLSPKQVDGRISLYVTPMDKSNDLKESPNARTFHFDRSPAKDLQEINRIVSSAALSSCKRSLSNPDSYEQRTMKTKKLDRLLSDRQQQESNGNAK